MAIGHSPYCTHFYVVTRSARHEPLRVSWLAGIRPIQSNDNALSSASSRIALSSL